MGLHPKIPEFRRVKELDQEFEMTLNYTVRSCLLILERKSLVLQVQVR